MERRIKISLFLFVLILIVIIIGNYIHFYFTKKGIDYENKDTYFKLDKNNLSILVEVDRKKLYLIDTVSNKIVKEYIVATGKLDSPTPLGNFKVTEKARWGGGFGSRWIGLNVPWGRYGIHGTNQPDSIGFNTSAGCIRMRNTDIEELYNIVEYDTNVIVINGEFGPFSHGFRNLCPGDRGADVLEVQKRLQIKGYYTGAIDGIYGEGMKQSLIKYLKDNNMNIDHKIDYQVYESLGIILME